MRGEQVREWILCIHEKEEERGRKEKQTVKWQGKLLRQVDVKYNGLINVSMDSVMVIISATFVRQQLLVCIAMGTVTRYGWLRGGDASKQYTCFNGSTAGNSLKWSNGSRENDHLAHSNVYLLHPCATLSSESLSVWQIITINFANLYTHTHSLWNTQRNYFPAISLLAKTCVESDVRMERSYSLFTFEWYLILRERERVVFSRAQWAELLRFQVSFEAEKKHSLWCVQSYTWLLIIYPRSRADWGHLSTDYKREKKEQNSLEPCLWMFAIGRWANNVTY